MHRQNLVGFQALTLIVVDVCLLVRIVRVRGMKGEQDGHATMLLGELRCVTLVPAQMLVSEHLRVNGPQIWGLPDRRC